MVPSSQKQEITRFRSTQVESLHRCSRDGCGVLFARRSRRWSLGFSNSRQRRSERIAPGISMKVASVGAPEPTLRCLPPCRLALWSLASMATWKTSLGTRLSIEGLHAPHRGCAFSKVVFRVRQPMSWCGAKAARRLAQCPRPLAAKAISVARPATDTMRTCMGPNQDVQGKSKPFSSARVTRIFRSRCRCYLCHQPQIR